MSGTLFVVATPIGNLEDITLRALRVLREADVVAAEDTRRTARLLQRHGIQTPTLSFHAHNARARTPGLVTRLKSGERVALVTDAGTPGVSDPGVELVRACIGEGIAVDPVPGPSAVLTAAVGSGFPLVPLTFAGFSPNRAKDRIGWLEDLADTAHTVVFYEAPHRILQALGDIARVLGDRQIVVAREMTKVHQEFLRGTATEVSARLTSTRGEFTVVIGPADKSQDTDHVEASDEEIVGEFGRITNSGGFSRRQAVVAVARKYGRPVRDVYAVVERRKNLG
jgi:16S rRNA (cytidine1402-2'-O)-methyltransferase